MRSKFIILSIILYYAPRELNSNLIGNINTSDIVVVSVFLIDIIKGIKFSSQDYIFGLFITLMIFGFLIHGEIELLEVAVQYFLCFIILKKTIEVRYNVILDLLPNMVMIVSLFLLVGLVRGYILHDASVFNNHRFVNTFGNANGLGSTLAILIFIAISIEWKRPLHRNLCLLILGLSLVSTLSFGSVILTLLLIGLFAIDFRKLLRAKVIAGTVALVLIGVRIYGTLKSIDGNGTVTRLLTRIGNLNQGDVGSSEHRIRLMFESYANIQNNLLIGVGHDQSFHGINVVHNQYLLLAEQYGIIVAIVFVFFLIIHFRNSTESWRLTLLWMIVMLFVLSTKTHYYSRIFYGLMFMGLTQYSYSRNYVRV